MADASELEPVYLLTGSDRPKIEVALKRLRRHFVSEAIELTTAQELAGKDVAAVCNAGSLFGDARLVIVEHIDGVRSTEGRLDEAVGRSPTQGGRGLSRLAGAVDDVLALVAEELKKDAALYKACAKAGTVLDFSVQKSRLASWVGQQFAAKGARAEPDACAALVQLVGEDLQQLASEMDKLATWAGGEPIGEREVEALVAALAETSDYKLADVWSQRDPAALLRRERGDLRPRPQGEPGRQRPPVSPLRRAGAGGRAREATEGGGCDACPQPRSPLDSGTTGRPGAHTLKRTPSRRRSSTTRSSGWPSSTWR